MYYDEIAKGYDELYREEQLKKLSLLKEHLTYSRNSKVLDVGCGSGFSSDFDCFVAGVDPSLELLRLNKSAIKIQGVAENLPFKAKSFDIIISISAIQNFENIELALSEMERVGRGNFAISAPKKSPKIPNIRKEINNHFKKVDEIEEDKDIIFLCLKA